ncbi:hypothetical protein FB45DRAFT_1034922 [Roridomyces roridus]|uniref:Uncharacterized protein n=1 Tax=Roridomyces roridus TaxID=1738132 RepID=A0AAD7BCJ9_9AGAR|nr:hypothetical protein FB45DRAFT_1034922 [Roridomyces roridus]
MTRPGHLTNREWTEENSPDDNTNRSSGLLGRLEWLLFTGLCLASHGTKDLKHVEAALKLTAEGEDDSWARLICKACEHLNNMLLMATLLLSTTAVFLTTSPPLPHMFNYSLRMPYVCLLNSFEALMGGVIVAAVTHIICVTLSEVLTSLRKQNGFL